MQQNQRHHWFIRVQIRKIIHDLEATVDMNSKTMVHLHWLSSGSFVSGEIKAALSLRLLAGGSYFLI